MLLVTAMAGTLPYGLDAPTAIGPFLDGVFPSHTPPSSPGGFSATVVDAFPNLPVNDTVVIVPNPADDRLYVGSRGGTIISFQNDPSAATYEPFMDLTDRVASVWDGGFLGMVFHPQFGQVGSPYQFTFYAYYSSYCPVDAEGDDLDFSACNPGYPQSSTDGFFGTWLRLSRFRADWDPVAQVHRGDPASEEPMISIRLYNGTHRGGGLLFANDGFLYLTIGDQSRYTTAQDIVDNLEGGTLRLATNVTEHGDGTWDCPGGSHQPRRTFSEVSANPDEVSGRLYCIPDDNPWLDSGGSLFEEYFSIGHRNPHRLALDPVTGLLWSGEVGEVTREEINVILSGRNYGWPFREGTVAGPGPTPATIRGILTEPVIDFPRADAQAVIGGYVYRGARFPELTGRFIAGDYITQNIWAITLDTGSMQATSELIATYDPGGLATFGQDNQGEIYLGSVGMSLPLQQLERVNPTVGEPPLWLSAVGAFDDLATLDVHAAAIPYEPLAFWSDGAEKSRWIFLPNDGDHDDPAEQIVFSENDNWTCPLGTVLMKHFELQTDESDPGSTTRLETRFLILGDDDRWYGLNYRWLADQSDAQLLATAETGEYTINTVGGGTRLQAWYFPSRANCLRCHNPGAGGVLGPRTHQLNRDLTYPSTGRTDNQLRTWNHLGIFSPPLNEVAIPGFLSAKSVEDATASLEVRARSYLDTNCSYCHRPETGNRAAFDARLTTPLDAQGLIWGGAIDPLGLPEAYLIRPGDPASSIVHVRAAALGAIAMPPLAKSVVDDAGVDLLANWIERIDPDTAQSGVHYEYYEVVGLEQLPVFDSLSPNEEGLVANFDLSVRNRDDDFAFRFTATLELPTGGAWTFYTSSDDGSQLFVDGQLIVDNDGLHALQEASGGVSLSAGYHALSVTMFERAGGEELEVSWEGPGVPKDLIPSDRLFQGIPGPLANDAPLLSNPGTQSSPAGVPLSLSLAATDPDGDSLYYSAAGLPLGLVIDSSSGSISGTIAPTAVGPHGVVASASDGPTVSVVNFTWTVLPAPCSFTAPPVGLVDLDVQSSGLSWSPLVDASGFDVVRGDLGLLQASAGDFGGSVLDCPAGDHDGTSLPFTSSPGAEQGFWFLVRGRNCAGPGSYDSGGPGQAAPRDPELAAPPACP